MKNINIKDDPNYEKYKRELAESNPDLKESDFGYEMLFCLHKHFAESTDEQLQKEWEEVEKMTEGIQGPTVDEYFESINPTYQYIKGYKQSAEKFKNILIQKLREKDEEQVLIPISEVITMVNKIYDEE